MRVLALAGAGAISVPSETARLTMLAYTACCMLGGRHTDEELPRPAEHPLWTESQEGLKCDRARDAGSGAKQLKNKRVGR